MWKSSSQIPSVRGNSGLKSRVSILQRRISRPSRFLEDLSRQTAGAKGVQIRRLQPTHYNLFDLFDVFFLFFSQGRFFLNTFGTHTIHLRRQAFSWSLARSSSSSSGGRNVGAQRKAARCGSFGFWGFSVFV